MFLLSVFIAYFNVSESAADGCIGAATFISMFVAGFSAARKHRRSGLVSGIAAGAVYVLIMLLTGFLFFGNLKISAETLKMFLICIFAAALGGIIGINTKKSR